MSLPDLALRRPVTTVAATLALVLLGAVSLGRLPVSLLSDVTLPVLTTRTNFPGAAAPEVPRFIAGPAGVYEEVDGVLRVNAPNCVDCKATDVLGPRWTPREGGSGPKYKRM
jgi:multidrug efflux pump subunit AcrB